MATEVTAQAAGEKTDVLAPVVVPDADRPVDDSRTVPVTLLRAAAAVLGFYGYVVALWFAERGTAPQPIPLVRQWLNRPMNLGEDFGPLAVMLLLVCTGYAAASTGCTVRRLVRVYLPVLVATGLAAAALLAGLDIWTTPDDAVVTFRALAGNLTFLSYGVPAAMVLVPLAWFVGLQLLGWLVALDRRTWPTTLVLLAVVCVLCLVAQDRTPLGQPLLFLPLVLVGHLAWRVRDGGLPAWAGVLLGAACLGAVILVDRTFTDLAAWWYPVTAVYAVLLLLTAVRTAGATAAAIAAHPVVRWLAGAAEWLLLVGGVVWFAMLDLVVGR